MSRTVQNNVRKPIINLHIQDPFELAQEYHDILHNDEFNQYISCTLQHQYHMNYSNPFLSHEDKIQRLSFLSSCLHDLENLKQETALGAANVIIDSYQSLGEEANKEPQKKSSTMSKILNGFINKGDKLLKIYRLENKIKLQLSVFTQTFSSGVYNIEAVNTQWNAIHDDIQLLHQLKIPK
jgi:hypothetical protein